MKRRTMAIALSAVMAAGLLAGCGGQSAAPAAPAAAPAAAAPAAAPAAAAPAAAASAAAPAASEAPAVETTAKEKPAYDRLTIYTSYPETELPTYFDAFEADTGIQVDYVRLAAGEMITRVMSEKDNPQASLVYGPTVDNFAKLASEGLLEKYESPELANVPDKYKSEDGLYSPLDVRAICFTVNREWFQENNMEYPQTWDDLLQPEFKDQISMAHPATSGTSYPIVAGLVTVRGEDDAFEYFKKLNENVRHYTKSGAAPPEEVSLGEAAITMVFSHDGLKPSGEGYPVDITFPVDGTPMSVEGVALIANGPEKEHDNAKRFIDWAMSVRGQECYIDSKSNRIPVNTGAKVTDGLPNLDDINTISYDPVWAADNKEKFVERFIDEVANADNLG